MCVGKDRIRRVLGLYEGIYIYIYIYIYISYHIILAGRWD